MQRSRLKNIINKAKEISNKKEVIGDPFDRFMETLPKELIVGENYRMKAAWKAYGSPSSYKEALWEGMIQPIDENTYKLPSIGYNEETDEYEYLNKGKENDIVAKDIRVWDNDVIPFVQELKRGGFIRLYNEEKDCWTYTKNKPQNTLDQEQINIQKEQRGKAVDYLKQGEKNKRSELILLNIANNSQAPFMQRILTNDKRSIPEPQKHWENGKDSGRRSTHILSYGEKNGKTYVFPEVQEENGELKWFDWPQNLDRAIQNNDYLEMSPEEAEWFTTNYKSYYPHYFGTQSFKQGGQMSVIPEGALHARKNNMEGAGEDFTAKGIPVVDNEGEQQAEIERDEIIFRKEVTDKMEELYKKYNSEESSSKKDEIAIEMGKIITCEITKHTQDNTGLIDKIQNQ